MKEDYLQFIWSAKRLLNPNLKLANGVELKVIRFGAHNKLLNGPDFFNAAIELDGLIFHGNIELHVKSSDWYIHKHHLDRNYDNVILHVVLDHDKEVIQNGVILPTLELREHIDWEHHEKFEQFRHRGGELLCGLEIESLDPVYLELMKERCLYEKLYERVELIQNYASEQDDLLYYFLAAAFGSNLNKLAFLELAQRIPKSNLVPLNFSQRFNLLMSESGIMSQSDRQNDFHEKWHFRGTRPSNFPTVRLRQFAQFIVKIDFNTIVAQRNAAEIIRTAKQVFSARINNANSRSLLLSKQFVASIIINGLVPYLWYLGEHTNEQKFQDLAIDTLKSLPKENNGVIQRWKKTKVSIKNAFDTQALLALYKYYCNRKKCLSCQVGNRVLKSN